MTRTSVVAALAVIAACTPAVSFAAPETPAAQAKAIGQCLVRSDRGAAISVFQRQLADGSAADLSAAGACAKGGASVSAMQLRGGIAEALYARDFREAGVTPHTPMANFAQLDLPEGAADKTGMFTAGACVAQKRFADIDQLFATAPGSDREKRFIDNLMPHFSACQPRGTRMAIKRGEMRPLIAQAVYAESVRYWRMQAAMR